jgi:hypothetical protein
MAEPSDLKTIMEALKNLQEAVQANAQMTEANAKAIAGLTADRTSTFGPKSGFGEHHNDRPPQFQKMDFPRHDGKTDPLIFINRW